MTDKTYRSILEDLKTTESYTEVPEEAGLEEDFSEKEELSENTAEESVQEEPEGEKAESAAAEEEPERAETETEQADEKPSDNEKKTGRIRRKGSGRGNGLEEIFRSDYTEENIIENEGTAERKNNYTTSRKVLGNPIITLVLFAVFASMCAVFAFLIPSAGTVMKDDNIVAQRNASSDINSGIGLITTNIVNEVRGMPKLFLLPVTDSPGAEYSAADKYTYKDDKGITHTVYEDPSITVDMWRVKKKLDGRSYVANYAKVRIAHPTQLRTSVSTSGYRNRSKPSVQAKKMNAIVAINGDFFTLRNNGVIIRQGTYYSNKKSGKESLFIDSDGNFHFMSSAEAINSGFLENTTVYNSLSFGPVLVRDGVLCQYKNAKKDKLATMNYGRNPRTGIGQIGELEYLMIVVDGRTYDSAGLTTSQFAKLFYNEGCVNAYNLDGGQSSCMVFMGKVYNTVSNSGERMVSDIVYFASAMPDEDEL